MNHSIAQQSKIGVSIHTRKYSVSPKSGIKLMFVIDTLEVGGTEQSLVQLVKQLQKDHFDCVICSLYPGSHLAAQLAEAGANVIKLELPGKYSFAIGIHKLSKIIRLHSPDLVHTMLYRANQIGRVAGWRCKVPVVSSFVNVPYDKSRLETDVSVKRWKLRCLQAMDAITSRLVVQFHSVSETAKEMNCRDLRISLEKVKVVPRGRDTSAYQNKIADSPARLISPRVLNVGRLIPQKGQRELIHAFQSTLEQTPKATLMIAGDGPLMGTLQTEVNRLNLHSSVSILGRRNDIPDLLGQADVFAFPSLYEGLPGSLIEAMLAGLPIVASDIPQVRELIEHERTGLLVPAHDKQALAAGLSRIFNDRQFAIEIGTRARRIALTKFDMGTVTEQMKSFYRDVADNPNTATTLQTT